MSVLTLLQKSITTLKYEGSKTFIKKTINYSRRRILRMKSVSNYSMKDILFINGCSLPHPARYRVDHQIEQLHFSGYSCDSVYYEDLKIEAVKYYRAFVFFRCPHTEVVEDLIKKAKYFNKTVFFDIDDLVIDSKYVENIKHLEKLSKEEYAEYMDGVNRTKRTLSMCDYAITTTARLANELQPYVKEVFINRNVASEKMVELSLNALETKKKQVERGSESKIILGYFSGSITHNEDFDLILPAIKEILLKNSNVYLKVVGILDIPNELAEFQERIIFEKFTEWVNLPELIAGVDINLAPLVKTTFNEAKSENKWMEAALVKVPTIASKVGAFEEIIVHGETGILCTSDKEWVHYLEKMISDATYRVNLAEKAHDAVMDKWTTLSNGYSLYDFVESNLSENIAFVLPSTQISGGVNVVIKHCNILRQNGKDVSIISMGEEDNNIENSDGIVNVISYHKHQIHAYFAKAVATLWTTNHFISTYPKIKDKYYLVQNFETRFYEPGKPMRVWANLTYNSFNNMNYVTISTWCKNWLENKYHKKVEFAPNGIDLSLFPYKVRNFDRKIRILVEGNSEDYYKNVDESFEITNKLDPSLFEIWYLSYKGKPKEWYRVDRFLNKVPHEKVSEVYAACHILLKSSILESFSYPPLEMMATGGISIVAPNEGNVEYLRDNENCLLYEQGDIDSALKSIFEICENKDLRESIIKNGLKTAESRAWNTIESEIVELYGYKSTKDVGEKNYAFELVN